jgi:hypothetical protein
MDLRDFDGSGLPFLDADHSSGFIHRERGENSFYGDSSDYQLKNSAYLAEFYLGQHRLKEAESVYIHTIKRIEVALGEGHPDVAWTYDFLFLLHNDQGNFQEADELALEEKR